jgi:predicted RNA methylase
MRFFAIALLSSVSLVSAAAQQFGAGENLAPYIPTPQILVDKMLEAAVVTSSDVVYDLGSGDGRIIITAAQKYGARAVGVEIRGDLCRRAEQRIRELNLGHRASVVHGSVMRTDLSPATVVTMYFLTGSNEKLRPTLDKYLKPGARVVSNDYPIRGWEPVRLQIVKVGSVEHRIYVYEIGKTR